MGARLIIFLPFLFLLPPATLAADAPHPATIERFEKKVRPLLAARCWQCHGAEKVKGGLRLDSAEAVATGGDSGPCVVPGKPEESLLIRAVHYQDDLKMPPKGKLDAADANELVEWVRAGAAWPANDAGRPDGEPAIKPGRPALANSDGPFWAFQPATDPAPPLVKDAAWATSPIDRFILSGLERKGLAPAPPAEKRVLIRRVSFDLTGLPPTVEEIDAFLADNAPTAFEKVVDRLLASPRYGERWGRHWLDLARYADSNGMDENVAYANAFRYRDYVVGSFNADKPYDRFAAEQIAGDLIPDAGDKAANREALAATGFLVIGPKMLAEDDPVKMEMDIIDEQVDTVGRVFLGLTFGCARCHDHKFDPIPTADYYGLAGIFKSTRSMKNHTVVAMWNERAVGTEAELAALDAHKAEVASREEDLKTRTKKARADLRLEHRERLADYLEAAARRDRTRRALASIPEVAAVGDKAPGNLTREAESFDRGNVLIDTTSHGREIGVILNRGELPNRAEYDIDLPTDAVYQVEIRHAAAESRPVRLKIDGALVGPSVAGAVTGSWGPETQAWSAAARSRIGAGRHTILLECDGAFPHIDKIALVPIALPEGVELATLMMPGEPASDRPLNPRLVERWADALGKGRDDPASILHALGEAGPDPKAWAQRAAQAIDAAKKLPLPIEDANLAALRRAIDDPNGPFALPKNSEALFAPEAAEGLRDAKAKLAEIQAKAPPITEVMGVEDQKPTDLRVHIRGNHLTLGAEVPRRFPQVLANAADPSIDTSRSGRLELARWLARKDHPLTARVMANRIWLWHFGEGIVRSPDNFGNLGERPDHPELLDWLATRFVESGWSVKAMHRLILLSSTYRMSTRHDPRAALVDPENRLLWHVSRRRLEAEAIRDALFMVGGELDETMGGTLLATKNHAYVKNTATGGDLNYAANRRAIYLPVIRSGMYDVFQAFDFADPSTSNGKRIPTTVAPQALFMMNDPVVLRSSDSLAGRLLARAGLDDRGRIEAAYLSAYGRPPAEAEVGRASAYLRRFEAELEAQGVAADARPRRAWQALCQAIVSASEFVYLD